MEEAILRWISALGFPICSAIALGWAIIQIFRRYESAVTRLQETTLAHAEQVKRLSHESNQALGANTQATNILVTTQKEQNDLLKKFGSDPLKQLCRISEFQEQFKKDTGVQCQAALIEMALTKKLEEMAAREAAKAKKP